MAAFPGPPLRSALGLALVLVVSACASEPSAVVIPKGKPSARDRMVVELLDPWFLTTDGERVAIPEFLYRFREDCRRWAAAEKGPPTVELRCVSESVSPRMVRDFEDQLQLAGVLHIQRGLR